MNIENTHATPPAERPKPITLYNKHEARCPKMVVSALDFDALVIAKANLERQLAEAREGWSDEIRKAQADERRAEAMVNQAREQRDRLAEALCVAYGLITRHHEVGVKQELGCFCPVCHRDGKEPEMDQIIAAIAAVKEQE